MEGDENIIKKAKDPGEWLNEYCNNDEDKIKAVKERNYIENDFDLKWEDIELFEIKRSEKLKEQLKKIFNESEENNIA